MLWFKKKNKAPELPPQLADPINNPPIEVVAHKTANRRDIQAVKDANEKLGKVFERNHFTVKLYVAAGGRAPKATTK